MTSHRRKRRGTVLILVILLLFALLGLTALVIDVGMARMTSSQLQSFTDCAALEGAWARSQDIQSDDFRDASVQLAERLTDPNWSNDQVTPTVQFGWGPHAITFSDGVDLDQNLVLESGRTLSIGAPVRPTLQPNIQNHVDGDIVSGRYDATTFPVDLPPPPDDYDRGPVFVPEADGASVLVRMRRTDEVVAGGTTGPRLPYLFGVGSLLDLGLKGQGMAVRGESIAQLEPAVMISPATDDALIPLIGGVARIDQLDTGFDFRTLDADRHIIGALPGSSGTPALNSGCLAVSSFVGTQEYVIGFIVCQLTAVNNQWVATPVPQAQFNGQKMAATANLMHAWPILQSMDADTRSQLYTSNRQLSQTLPHTVLAAALVRSHRIGE